MPYHARFPGGAFSMASSTAPPHSPPSPSPWPKRQSASRSGAANADGRRRSAARRWRPSRFPSSGAPRRGWSCGRRGRRSGRTAPIQPAGPGTRFRTSPATRAWPKPGSEAGKNSRGKDDHRGGGVDVEVEELDRRADQAGKQHLARRVDGLGSGRCRGHGSQHSPRPVREYRVVRRWLQIAAKPSGLRQRPWHENSVPRSHRRGWRGRRIGRGYALRKGYAPGRRCWRSRWLRPRFNTRSERSTAPAVLALSRRQARLRRSPSITRTSSGGS